MLVRVLLALDDDARKRRLTECLPTSEVVPTAHDTAEMWQALEHEPIDLVLVERAAFPGDPGPALARLRQMPERPEVVILCTRHNAEDTARLQEAGCFAVIPQDASDEQLRKTLARLVEHRQQSLATRVEASQAPRATPFEQLRSRNDTTRELFRLAARVAASDTTLLITGETGVGKEWLARTIHGESPRASGPFVAINCGAIPEGLLESELFGHERGAFTGAVRARRGHFELAHRGTLFLDEVAEMPSHLQVKLLRVLQDRRIQRLGGEIEISTDARIIAATNQDLAEEMRAGAFRQDLFYRLAVVTLRMPALRERPEDVAELLSSYREKLSRKLGRPEISGIAPHALRALEDYSWPGNVRELINVVERAVLLSDGPWIDLPDLPAEIATGLVTPAASSTPDILRIDDWLDQPLEAGKKAVTAAFERRYLERHLALEGGHIGRTAQRAGIDPRSLYNKMRRLGLSKETFKDR